MNVCLLRSVSTEVRSNLCTGVGAALGAASSAAAVKDKVRGPSAAASEKVPVVPVLISAWTCTTNIEFVVGISSYTTP